MEFLSNASSQQEPPLGIEDWNLGQNLLQSQVSSSRVAQRPVNGNTGCFRAQCYCDARRCKRPSGWQRFGSFTVPGSVGQSSNVSMDTAVPSTDVFIVWGLEQQTSNDASASGLTFQAALNWADPQLLPREAVKAALAQVAAFPGVQQDGWRDEAEVAGWAPLDPMSVEDVAVAPDTCVEHLELHGCAMVREVLRPEACECLKDFVDKELQRERRHLERLNLGSVRERQHRWDLKLPLAPTVRDALREVTQNLEKLLVGTVELDAGLVELSCLISDPSAVRQNVHVDTGGWKTRCAPLLTVFVALQEVTEAMGPTVVFPGTHDDPYLQQNSRLLHCGGANLLAGGSRRRLFYMTWQKPKNTNHGSTYSILDALAGRYDLRHVVRRTPTVEAIAEVDEERIALEISAKKKETSPRFGDETVNRADPGAMLDFALRLRQEGDPGAVEWLRATGRKGHPLACMHLAEMYCLGELGLETNYEAAEELRKFAFGLFSHLADRSETKPRLQEFLENHTEVQREQLRTCEATPPEMEVLSRKCFASDFKTWLESKGERYPVKPSELYAERLQEFAEEHGREKEWRAILRARTEEFPFRIRRYFWRAPTGGLAGTVARLRVPRDTPRQQLQEGWQHYMSLRTLFGVGRQRAHKPAHNWGQSFERDGLDLGRVSRNQRMAPWRSQAWTALEAITEEEELQLLQAATNEVALLLVMMLALWTCLFTFSLRMALAGACAGGFGILMFFLCQPFGPQSAALQLLCLLLLVTTLVAPASRFLFFYSGARNGPSKRVKNEKSTSFEIEESALLKLENLCRWEARLGANSSTQRREDAAQEPKEVRQEAIPRSQTQRFVSLAAEDPQLQKEKEEQQRRAQAAGPLEQFMEGIPVTMKQIKTPLVESELLTPSWLFTQEASKTSERLDQFTCLCSLLRLRKFCRHVALL
eukprot:g24661.t1